MNLLVFILISARFLCFVVVKMLHLQYLWKSEKIGSFAIDLEALQFPFKRTIDDGVGIAAEHP